MPVPVPRLVAPVLPLFQDAPPYPGPAYGTQSFPDPFDNASLASDPSIDAGPPGVNIIADNNSTTKGNMFCFGAFADKHTGTLYNDLTSSFPFMSLYRNMCYLIVYHYETNGILALPIVNLEDCYSSQEKYLCTEAYVC